MFDFAELNGLIGTPDMLAHQQRYAAEAAIEPVRKKDI